MKPITLVLKVCCSSPIQTLSVLAFCCLNIITSCKTNDDKENKSISNAKVFAFSDSVKMDTLKIETIGNNTDTMLLVFTIKSFENQTIFKQQIKAGDLLKSYLASAELKKEKEKQQFIKDEVAQFFIDEHLMEPAVAENEQPDKYTPDLSFYNELKKNGLNGFSYRLGKDKKYYIAWSAKEKKVKIYYQCC